MTEETLRELIAGGETATVEFKIKAPRPAELAERMCEMANNRAGGIIIFGIEDASRAIDGIRHPSLTNDVVLRAARMIKPAVPVGETSGGIAASASYSSGSMPQFVTHKPGKNGQPTPAC